MFFALAVFVMPKLRNMQFQNIASVGQTFAFLPRGRKSAADLGHNLWESAGFPLPDGVRSPVRFA